MHQALKFLAWLLRLYTGLFSIASTAVHLGQLLVDQTIPDAVRPEWASQKGRSAGGCGGGSSPLPQASEDITHPSRS